MSPGRRCLHRRKGAVTLDLDLVLSTAWQRIAQQCPRREEEVQWSPEATVGDVRGQGFLMAQQRAEVGHRPVKAGQSKPALDEPGRLPECHAKQHRHRKARLDSGIAVGPSPAASACRRGVPRNSGLEPAVRPTEVSAPWRLRASLPAGQIPVL